MRSILNKSQIKTFALIPPKEQTGVWCEQLAYSKVKSWGFTSHSTARVILGQVLSIVSAGLEP